MDQQCHYVGLDVSLETTSICVIDDAGAIIWRGKCRSDPDTITAIVRQHAPGAARVGLETGQLSNWLTLSLRRRGVPVVCMDARHAKAALSLQINKTDANDAFGLAQVVRTGWYREVAVKSMDAHTLRMLLVARSRLVSQRQATANTICGLLKTFGLVVAKGSKGLFPVRVREQIAGNPALIAIIEPLLAVWYAISRPGGDARSANACPSPERSGCPAADDNPWSWCCDRPGLHRSNRRSRTLSTIGLGRCVSRPDPPALPVR